MTMTLEHLPSGRSLVLDRSLSLNNSSRRSFEQDILSTDSGKEKPFTRKVPKLFIDGSINGLSHRQQAALEGFYFQVLKESKEVFKLTANPTIFTAPLQAGDTVGGNPVVAGQAIKCSPSDPGFIVEAGQFIRDQDFNTVYPCRIIRASFSFNDILKKASTVRLQIVVELDPVPC